MRLAIASICLSCIIVLALAGLVFAQVGVEKNRITVKINSLSLDIQHIPYGGTATLTATLNNTSPFLSGTTEVRIVPPSNLRSMVNLTGTQNLFFDIGQKLNVTLTIKNLGTLAKTANGTFSLEVADAGWMITDKADFQLSLGANPDFQNASETDASINSTVIVTCVDRVTNLTLSGIAVEVTIPETATAISNATNSTGQCTLNLGTYPMEINDAIVKASDPTGQYLSASQTIFLPSGPTQVTLFMEQPSNDSMLTIEVVAAIVIIGMVGFVSFEFYRNKKRKKTKNSTESI